MQTFLMALRKKKTILVFSAFIILTCLLFWRTFLRGEYLFPGKYLISFFSPYTAYNAAPLANKPVADDVFRHIYPFKTLAIDIMKRGELPLWNPYNGAGEPLLATQNSGFFDPLNILYFFLPYILAWNWSLMLQFLSIGFFTYIYCRKIKVSTVSSLFAAVSFSFSSVVIIRLSLGAYDLGIAMLPLLLFLTEWYIQNKNRFSLPLVSLAVYTLAVSTHPQITLYITLFSSLYAVIRLWPRKGRNMNAVISILVLGLFYLLGVGLAGIQLVPTLELLKYSHMSVDTSVMKGYLLSWYHLVSFVIPNYFGNISTYNFWGKTDYVETVAAIGSLPCLYAYIAVRVRNKEQFPQIQWIFLITFLASCLLAVQSPLTNLLLSLSIPLVSSDPPSRILLLNIFSLSVLSGLGLDAIWKAKVSFAKYVRLLLPYLLVLVGIAGITFLFAKTNHPCRVSPVLNCYSVALRNTLLEYSVFMVGLVVLFFGTKKKKPIAPIFLVALVSLIGLYNADKFLPFSPKQTILPKNGVLQTLQTLPTIGRVYGYAEAMMTTDLATYFRFYDPQYYHPLSISRYGEFTGYTNTGISGDGVSRGDALLDASPIEDPGRTQRRDRAFTLLGVNYSLYNKQDVRLKTIKDTPLWQDNTNVLFNNPNEVPRISFASDVLVRTTNDTILSTVFAKTFDPSSEVVLEENPNIAAGGDALIATSSVSLYQENQVMMTTKTNKASVMVLSDNYYPGWKATIDGKETKIYRANYTFRGIVLPSGTHSVRFFYDPISVRVGGLVSLLSVCILFLSSIAIAREQVGKRKLTK